MSVSNSLVKISFFSVLILIPVLSSLAQEPAGTPPIAAEEEEILKIDTNLIQTGVTVTNKNGEFIDNLKQEDFEVRVDGKPITTKFFDKVIERRQNSADPIANNAAIVERGRTLIFLVDDVHLGAESNIRTRKLIEKFIDEEMLDDDVIAIIASSGRIGFLQQFTNDKIVLKAALERIKYNRSFSGNSDEAPPMSENEALSIDRRDTDTFQRFVSLTMKLNPGMLPQTAAFMVNSRARSILDFALNVNKNTFSLLEESINKTRVLPGRKAIFFISDGFLIDPNNSDVTYRLNKITNAAARSNTVIYSFDAKGLDAGANRGAAIEMAGSTFSTAAGARFESQGGLNTLADKTGGRFIRNTNDLQTNLTKVSAEAFTYYLLAWEPETEDGQSERLRNIEVSVKGRPELKVRVNSGYLAAAPKAVAASAAKQLTGEQKLIAVTNALIPKREIPVALTANYLDLPGDGGMLSATIQIDSDTIEFTKEAAAARAELEIVGLIYNSAGKREKTFKVPLKLNADASRLTTSGNPPFYYEYQVALKPDLYQMRVAVRDVKSGRIGNTSQWLEIPDLGARKLQLSSLLIGERRKTSAAEKPNDSGANQTRLQLNVNRRFDNSSSLRYFGFIYNQAAAKNKSNLPEITIQAQILKQGKPLLTNAAQIVEMKEKDATRLPYGGEIELGKLESGRYDLKVIVSYPKTKTSATQFASFHIK